MPTSGSTPATVTETYEDLRPLLAQIDPAANQLVPILDFVGIYKRELNAFFANVTAATHDDALTGLGNRRAVPTNDSGDPAHVVVGSWFR